MRSVTFSLIFLVSLLSSLRSQESVYPVTNYTTKDYGKDFNPANSAIVQDKRGIIYAANGFTLLEYDGNKWNSYPINKQVWILSLAVDSSGIIYAGCQNEFGFFAPDAILGLKYVSLSDSLAIEDMNFSNVWRVHVLADAVVFQAEEKLFIYRNGKIKVVSPQTKFHLSFEVNNKLYVRQKGIGLMEWDGENFNKTKGGEIFSETGIFVMLPFGKGKNEILIGTRENGFWLLNNSNSATKISPFILKDKSRLAESQINGGVITGNGDIAIATLQNGLFIVDTSGTIRAIINEKSGLSDNEVKQVISDTNQNLWLALENGISRIDISSPVSLFAEKSGLEGTINTLTRFKNLIYAGTTSGLFVQQSPFSADKEFIKVSGIASSVRSLAIAEETLLAGTDAGLFVVAANNSNMIGSEQSFTIWYSPELKLLFSGGQKGLSVFKKGGSFIKSDLFKEVKDDILAISGTRFNKADSCLIWAGTRNSVAIRITLHKDLSGSVVRFNSNDGLAKGPILPLFYNDSIIFGTSAGLLRFKDETEVKAELPDSLKIDKKAMKGYFTFYDPEFGTTSMIVLSLAESNDKVWLCFDNAIGYFSKKMPENIILQPFKVIDAGRINAIFPEENGNCWIGTTEGLYKFNGNQHKQYDRMYSALIRNVIATKRDSILFAGVNFEKVNGLSKIVASQPESFKPILQFGLNSLRIEFAAPFFEHGEKLSFSCFLRGYDTRWSDWEHKFYQEYKNLPEGEYDFTVKAKNVYGTESTEAIYHFTILPPWYRTTGAIIFYGFVLILLVFLIVRIYSYRLKRENIRLEGIVAERTVEIVKQKNEIENKNIVLEYQKKEIQDSIRYARRIQKAVIPEEHVFVRMLPDGFVLFKPLDIVSGDFYWISRLESKTIITAADCTGHGVPGAFMSMLGVAFLNEIVNKDLVTETDLILNRLREKVIDALQQRGITGETKDGMDISILCLDEENKTLQYSGAFNPLLMIRNDMLIETEADRMPIAIYDNMSPFTKHNIDLQPGDTFYIFSDGYIDQFGGPDGKKFKMKEFKQLLLSIHKLPMSLQKEKLNRTFEEWKGDLKQIDDIVVVGLTVK